MKPRQKILVEALQDNPKMPTNTIAKLLYGKYPQWFKSVESARSALRYHRHEEGSKTRKAPNPIAMRTSEEKKRANAWARLPKSDAEKYEPFKIAKACDNILLLSDIHFPYHDVEALEIALQYGKDHKVNCIILNGDTLDMYAMSRFVKDAGKPDIGTELQMLTDFLQLLKDEFKCPIYFKWGNHEERWDIYLKVKAPELLSISDFSLDAFCKFGELGVIGVKDKRIIKAGKLNILHGHELGRSVFSPVNAARGLFTRAKVSAIMGHNHQVSEHTEKDLNGDVVTTWSQGCLCELNPQYMPINKWCHGFAHVKVGKNGNFTVDNMRIIDGRIR